MNLKKKLIIIGNYGVGKTSLVNLLLDKYKKDNIYTPTEGVVVSNIKVETNKENYFFEIWDVAGQEHLSGLKDGYYIGGEVGIILYDKYNDDNLLNWYTDLNRVTGDIPTFICKNISSENKNKFKKNYKKYKKKKILKKNVVYCNIDLNLQNVYTLFQNIIKKLYNINDFYIINISNYKQESTIEKLINMFKYYLYL